MTGTVHSRTIERGGFLLFLALVSCAMLVVIWPFVAPMLWAMLAAIMFQPLYRRMLARCGGRENPAAILALLVITVAVIIPSIIIGSMIVDQAMGLFLAFQAGQIDVAAVVDQVIGSLPASLQASLADNGLGNLAQWRERAQEFAEQSVGIIARQAFAIGGGVLGWVLAFGIGLYVTFFLLRDGARIAPQIIAALPVERSISDRLAERFLVIVRATIKGSVVVGLVQGALGAITFWIAGVPSALLFGLLMAIFSLLPALGPAIVWIPVAIYLLAIGAIWQGIVVIASGVAIIGMADNVLRPILVGRDTGIPDWMILVTTLGGIAIFGLSGIVLGPLVAGIFLTAWGIFAAQRKTAGSPA